MVMQEEKYFGITRLGSEYFFYEGTNEEIRRYAKDLLDTQRTGFWSFRGPMSAEGLVKKLKDFESFRKSLDKQGEKQ